MSVCDVDWISGDIIKVKTTTKQNQIESQLFLPLKLMSL